ncbi:hypothetical protein [Streptomyces sp. IBSBF 2435]|uniref:hypothetical protein n=1 Tax=Streptomyces sp. IBSBF 2435 TaxID=2903531 RepID=UPI002FDC37AB
MNDFDFLTASWDIANRRRADFLDADSAWEDFPGVATASRCFGGGADFDETVFPAKGTAGLTLRLYDPERGEWSLYWSSSSAGLLFPPVTGRFTDGTGVFHGDDTYHGKDVRARFTWSGA